MSETFEATVITDKTWHIVDPRGVIVYLIAGEGHALLIDTGMGEGDLKAYVATLTDLPLWVVNTHSHLDHTAGNGQFDEVYVHTADVPHVAESAAKLISIYDGYIFKLGNRDIRVISVPGHTPGSVCLLDEAHRILFSGDSPRPGPLWLHLDTSLTVQQARTGLAHLATFRDRFDTLAPSHGTPMPAGSLISDLIACADGILTGDVVGKPYQSRFGDALLAECGTAGIIYLEDRVQWGWASRMSKRIVSPEVHPDRTVTFRIKAPNARRVVLQSGPILNALGSADGSIGFNTVEEDGLWSLTVGPLPPDIYDYAFEIDGVAHIDSHCPGVQAGTGSPRSLFTVAADEPGYFEAGKVPYGTLHKHTYDSEVTGTVRDVIVYTPPDYGRDPERRYPVLYLLHGGGDDARGWTLVGQAHRIMDNLLAAGKAEPMIVVMPDGQAVPRSASFEALRSQNTPLFEQDLLANIMPLVESSYRIQADRDHRAMAGLSMGGGQTNAIGLNHLDLFSHIGIFSAGRSSFAADHPDLVADPAATNKKLALFFLGCGTYDPLAAEGMAAIHEELEQAGIDHIYWTLEGAGHTWVVWRTILYHEFLPRLWRK